jgi:hypothetical protein
MIGLKVWCIDRVNVVIFRIRYVNMVFYCVKLYQSSQQSIYHIIYWKPPLTMVLKRMLSYLLLHICPEAIADVESALFFANHDTDIWRVI